MGANIVGYKRPELKHHAQQKKLVSHNIVLYADVHAMGVTLYQLSHITDNARGDTFYSKNAPLVEAPQLKSTQVVSVQNHLKRPGEARQKTALKCQPAQELTNEWNSQWSSVFDRQLQLVDVVWW